MMQPFEKNGISLAVQQLRLYTSTAEGKGSIPGWGTKILHVAWHSQKKKKRRYSLYSAVKNFYDIYIYIYTHTHTHIYMNRDSYKYMNIVSFLCVGEGTKTTICIYTYMHKYTQEQFKEN